MKHSICGETVAGQLLLGAITFACYSATLSCILALGYSLAVLALTAAGQQVAAHGLPLWGVAP